MKVVFYGAGLALEKVLSVNEISKYDIVGIVDTYNFGFSINGIEVESINEFINSKVEYDYILICSQYDKNIKKILIENGINKNKIIANGLVFHKNIDKAIKFCQMNYSDNLTLISNNCLSGVIYKSMEAEYRSPFMWISICDEDYIELLKNMKFYLNRASEIEVSFDKIKNYPVGKLANITIDFVHYKDCESAYRCFNYRATRINWGNIVVIADMYDEKCIEEFLKLDIKVKNKILISKYRKYIYEYSIMIQKKFPKLQFDSFEIMFMYIIKYTNIFDLIHA
ncbi:exopolysaccharide biosynthesis protein [Clostridium carnis]|uniref:Exopolysaccharide biosynthesis protein n=1 Tax=Clostridium carnis TaxID=1530 RepID=A0ABY6SV13_9CLOT|nr:DUF1919 domain-containing protein [Clostridium carnis]VDG72428.1 exopolysaccharide biosynthesis protein [Clostridium carnis]